MRWYDHTQHLQTVAIWVLVIVLAAMVLVNAWNSRRSKAPRNGAGADESPEQVLKRRYAKGEIDRETSEC